MDEFKDALEGKIKTDGWDAEKLVAYHKFLSEAVDTTKGEVGGLREAKRVETERVAKAKADADVEEARLKALKESGVESPAPKSPEMTQFRSEQVIKAKQRLFSEVKLTPEEMVAVEEKFKLLDTGKIDADLIYLDFASSLAASNPTKFLSLSKQQDMNEAEAAAEIERQAAAGHAPPAGEERKKYSDAALDLSKKAGITPEAATKQLTEGMSRTYAGV